MYLKDNELVVRELTQDDFILMHKWLTNNNILKYFEGRDREFTYSLLKDDYFDESNRLIRLIMEYNGVPIGYGHIFKMNDKLYSKYKYPKTDEIVYGMEQFIGEQSYWGLGICPRYIKLIFEYLKNEKGCSAVILSPDQTNERALKAYKKVGFRIVEDLPQNEIFEGKKIDCYLMEYRYDDNKTNIKAAKYLLEHTFHNLVINNIEVLGSGNDSVAYLINNEYVFKIKYSNNDIKGYEKEKVIYDFLNSNMNTDIKIPNIEYSYITEEISILGYKQIKGKFLSPSLYNTLTNEEQQLLKEDISTFLSQMHSLDTTPISEYTIDNKQNVLEEYKLLRNTIYDNLTDTEKQYIELFMTRLDNTNIFNGRKCLCHNDFSCNHILLDDNNRLYGVIDFGDSGVTDEYTDFIYLLEDSEEEIGKSFGIDIINLCGDIDLSLALEYQDISEQYYPIELIVYGIKNNNEESIIKGREEINNRMNNMKRM